MTTRAVLQRKCACGDTCADCSKKPRSSEPAREVLRSPDPNSRFAHDFSQVRARPESNVPLLPAPGAPVEDSNRLRIHSVDDVLLKDMKSLKVTVMVKVPDAASVSFFVVGPDGRRTSEVQRRSIEPESRTEPDSWRLNAPEMPGLDDPQFDLTKQHVSAKAGAHKIVSIARDASDRPLVVAFRDFNVLASDLKTGSPQAGAHGSLTFTNYRLTNAKDPEHDRNVTRAKVTLEFKPDAAIACNDIAMIQAVQNLTDQGMQRDVHAEAKERSTTLDWHVDQRAGGRSPYYISDTDEKGVTRDVTPFLGTVGSGGKRPTAASIDDTPGGGAAGTRRFETCAVCRSGGNQGQVYGCATWGFRSENNNTMTLFPRAFNDTPSEIFRDAALKWNVWRGEPQWSDDDRPFELPELKTP
jgi:hypothetical protein